MKEQKADFIRGDAWMVQFPSTVDINDFEGRIIGVSGTHLSKELYARILKDNPLGEDDQQTPMGVIRKVKFS